MNYLKNVASNANGTCIVAIGSEIVITTATTTGENSSIDIFSPNMNQSISIEFAKYFDWN